MSSKLIVKVQRLHAIKNHPNADKLEIAVIAAEGGWETCIKKDTLTEGQLIVFVPPDSLMPRSLYEALSIGSYLGELPKTSVEAQEGYKRVRACNLRGAKSFGVVFTLQDINTYLGRSIAVYDGYDVAELLGIKKWIPKEKCMDGDAAKPMSFFHKYTDIQNYRNYLGVFKQGEPIVCTEKVHGRCIRFGLVAEDSEDGRVLTWAAGSNNVQRKEIDASGNRSDFWKPLDDNTKCMIAQLARENIDCFSVIVFGEQFGAVQDLKYGLNTKEVIVFDIAINGKYMDWDDMVDVCSHNSIKTVPELYKGPFSHEVIERYTDGDSIVSSVKQIREGIVFHPLHERYDEVLPNSGRAILKSVSINYLERKNAQDNA